MAVSRSTVFIIGGKHGSRMTSSTIEASDIRQIEWKEIVDRIDIKLGSTVATKHIGSDKLYVSGTNVKAIYVFDPATLTLNPHLDVQSTGCKLFLNIDPNYLVLTRQSVVTYTQEFE